MLQAFIPTVKIHNYNIQENKTVILFFSIE